MAQSFQASRLPFQATVPQHLEGALFNSWDLAFSAPLFFLFLSPFFVPLFPPLLSSPLYASPSLSPCLTLYYSFLPFSMNMLVVAYVFVCSDLGSKQTLISLEQPCEDFEQAQRYSSTICISVNVLSRGNLKIPGHGYPCTGESSLRSLLPSPHLQIFFSESGHR